MFDFAQADDNGVRLALERALGAGTTFSLLYTARLAYRAGPASGCCLDPIRALWLATAGSAGLLHIADRVGALDKGQRGGLCRARSVGQAVAGAPHG